MGRSAELFVIVALILLGFSLIARFFSTGLGISVTWRGTRYLLSPGVISVGMATALCFFATVYSLWMLPFNRTATLWHFWLTTIGIGVFWLAFYRVLNSRTTGWVWAVFAAQAAVLLTQLIFVWNLIQAVSRTPRLDG